MGPARDEGFFNRASWRQFSCCSGLARSGQAGTSDFFAILAGGRQIEIAEPDRLVAIVTLGQSDGLFAQRLGQIDLAVLPRDTPIGGSPADLMVLWIFLHSDLGWIVTGRGRVEFSRTALAQRFVRPLRHDRGCG
jgi:hypothetical protein